MHSFPDADAALLRLRRRQARRARVERLTAVVFLVLLVGGLSAVTSTCVSRADAAAQR